MAKKTTPQPSNPFEGFDVPQQNWFRLPNNWTNITAKMRSWAEHKVVEYVLRHTWGYREYGILKQISLDEFEKGRKRKDGTRLDNGVGLRRQAIISGLRQAVEDGFLIEQVDDSDKGRVKKYYGIRMKVTDEEGGYEDHTPAYDDHTPEVRSSHSRSMKIKHRTEKDTLERHSSKKNNNNSGDNGDQSKDVVVALIDQGITKTVANRLASRYNQDRIFEKIGFLDYLQEASPEKIANPRGWLRKAIEEDYGPPDGYKTPEEMEAEQQAAEQQARDKKAQDDLRAAETARKQQEAEKHREEQLKPLREAYNPSKTIKDLWSKWVDQISATDQMGAGLLRSSCEILAIADNQVVVWVANDFIKQKLHGRHIKTIRQLAAKHFQIPLTAVDLQIITSDGKQEES